MGAEIPCGHWVVTVCVVAVGACGIGDFAGGALGASLDLTSNGALYILGGCWGDGRGRRWSCGGGLWPAV